METRRITEEQKELLSSPLPAEAVTRHPTKSFLSSIKSIYVTERLNEVFGVGVWRIKSEVVDKGDKGMIVVKVTFSVLEYGIEYECYGGNNNGGEGSKHFDLGDAYKGAVTDAISKIGSWLGIGADVFKGKYTPPADSRTQTSASVSAPSNPSDNKIRDRKPLLMSHLANEQTCRGMMMQVFQASMLNAGKPFDPIAWLRERCEVSEEVAVVFREKYRDYIAIQKK